MAKAVAGVHGKIGRPSRLVRIGPKRVLYSVLVAVVVGPVRTVTVRLVMGVGLPSYRYVVGLPGTRVSWKGVNRNAVLTVWLHAMCAVWPMRTSGTPSRLPPVTSMRPGTVRCAW